MVVVMVMLVVGDGDGGHTIASSGNDIIALMTWLVSSSTW